MNIIIITSVYSVQFSLQFAIFYRTCNWYLGSLPEFRVPGSNPEKPGKITIFPGWKTIWKNPEITRKFQGSGFQPETRNKEKISGFQPGTRKNFRVPTRNPEKFLGSNQGERKYREIKSTHACL